MPSVSEPFGLTPLEAISYGTPSLVSRQSGISEVLKNCLKVDYWDTNEIANKITAAITNEALIGELRRNAFEEYEKFTWNDASEKVLAIYQKHLNRAVAL